MSSISKKEYFEFGPWLTRIGGAEDIPEQFASVKNEILGGTFMFKIPRNIDRSNAKEGMLLYDVIISIDDAYFKKFTCDGEKVESSSIALKDIVYMQYEINLLYGELILAAESEKVEIMFNTVSSDLIFEVVSFLRKHYVVGKTMIDLDKIEEKEVEESFLYRSLLIRERAGEKIKIVAYQPFMELKKGEATNIRQRLSLYQEPVLQDSMFLTNGRELGILTRVKEVKDEIESDYGYRHTYIPLENIKFLSMKQDEQLNNLDILRILVNDYEVEVRVGENFAVDALIRLQKR